MRKTLSFKYQDGSSEFEKWTSSYFQNAGFRLVASRNDYLEFKRGSSLGTMITFNPLKWESTIRVNKEKDQISLEANISTFGQAVTKKEEELWITFLKNYHKSLTLKLDLSKENSLNLNATKKNSLLFVKWAVIGAICAAIPAAIIAYFTDYDSIVPMAASSGALAAIMGKLKQENKNAL